MTDVNKYTEAQIEEIIKEHIVKMFMYNSPDAVLSSNVSLFEERIVDSLGIIRLARFIEEKFGVTINSEDLLLENFETINAIKSFTISRV